MQVFRRYSAFLLLLIVGLAATVSLAKKRPQPSPGSERDWAIHALNRLTFGPRPGDVDRVMAIGVEKCIEEQLHPDKIDDTALQARLAPFATLNMSARDMAERFPPPQVIKAVADGRMPMPSDPKLRAVYESLTEAYRFREQKQQQPTTNADGSGANDDEQMMSKSDRREARQAALLKAESLMQVSPDQRYDAIMRMAPDERRLMVQAMPEPERYKLVGDMKPAQRETLIAMVSPQAAVSTELQESKLLRAIYSERQLDEVMTDFWFNHFNVFLGKGADRYLVTSYERDVIRPHALGKFKDLLRATADSPAMLFYLDNWQSVGPNSEVASGSPRANGRGGRFAARRRQKQSNGKQRRSGLNENYARELMELHTLGVNGGYTQKDVTEVARVFTGWTLKEPRRGGGYDFNARMHEPGDKIVLGHKIKEHGEDEGKQVLDLLAHHPATARFISTKLAMRFVSDTPPQSLVDRMAKTFLAKDGDIREVLRTMFASPEFWAPEAQHAKVKTPLEFVVSAVRASGADVKDALPLATTLNRMGMPLYGAQPPTGYPMKADAWVNSAALLNRLNFALALASGRLLGTTLASREVVRETASTGAVAQPASMDTDAMLAQLEQALLARNASAQTHNSIRKQLDEAGSKGQLNTALATGLILGSPEFQRR
jgi:uncharacterized protein (DUF1800 family)